MNNKLKQILGCGDIAKGFLIMYPSPGVIERIGGSWDWIWIDGQHGQLSYDSVLACVRACELAGTAPIVRVPSHDYGFIGLALDTGAAGVMVPMVNNEMQAKAIVKAAKFPPLGSRSFGGRRPIDLYNRSYAHKANTETLLIAQIETQEAISNAEGIASVDGIDVLFFSPDDIALELGLPMDKPRKDEFFIKEMELVSTAALKWNKLAGISVGNTKQFKIAGESGYRFIAAGNDVGLLVKGSSELMESINNELKGK